MSGRRKTTVRALNDRSARALMRLLAERGLSEAEIDRGLDYVAERGVSTMRESFVLAMSRARFTDAQLAAGAVFTFEEEAVTAGG